MYIMTLGKQMYPENSQYLLNHFKQATSHPYGYLLIDLKPMTPEEKRLQPNILANYTIPPHSIPPPEQTSIPSVVQAPHFDPVPVPEQTSIPHSIPEQVPEQIESMNSCMDCGTLFTNMKHLYRHREKHCHVHKKRLRDEDDITENDAFQSLAKRARVGNVEAFDEKINIMVNKGVNKKVAKRKAEKEFVSRDMDKFIKYYRDLLYFMIRLDESQLHRDNLDEINELVSRGRSLKASIKRVVKPHDYEDLFDSPSSSDTSDDLSDDINDDTSDTTSSDYDTDDNIPLAQLKNKL